MTWRVLGLDLGQAADFSALAGLEASGGPEYAPAYACRHLHRWPHRTPYGKIVSDVRDLCARPMFESPPLLAVDGTGVGQAVVEMVQTAGINAVVVPILITAGHAVTAQATGWVHVAKKQLASAVQALLQSGRLAIAASLPDAAVLRSELENFKVKITAAGNETLEAWRERDHDDLVLALAMACWCAEEAARQMARGGDPGDVVLTT